jgi:GNAT superfamily N-acetyltransferase
VKLGPLLPGDLDSAIALSAREGWNQTAADWRRLIRLEPTGCFAAREEGQLVGTVTTITYGRAMAWIGMMVIHPDFRRQGIGARLMQLALEYADGLGIPSVKLDATPAGRPLYESLGFVAEAEIERWQGVTRGDARPRPPSLRDDGHHAIPVLDLAAFGADRSRLLAVLDADSACEPLVAQPNGGTSEGYALAREGRRATYIGPIIATTPGAARDLLDGMLAALAGTDVCLDLHRGGLLDPAVLAQRGFSKRRELLRMHHGPQRASVTARSICASAGPELG